MERRKLTDDELYRKLEDLRHWRIKDCVLHKRFEFENFAGSLEFINAVGEIAERLDHHPDIKFGWGYAEIDLMTHDRGGITDFDFAVASEIDALDN